MQGRQHDGGYKSFPDATAGVGRGLVLGKHTIISGHVHVDRSPYLPLPELYSWLNLPSLQASAAAYLAASHYSSGGRNALDHSATLVVATGRRFTSPSRDHIGSSVDFMDYSVRCCRSLRNSN